MLALSPPLVVHQDPLQSFKSVDPSVVLIADVNIRDVRTGLADKASAGPKFSVIINYNSSIIKNQWTELDWTGLLDS